MVVDEKSTGPFNLDEVILHPKLTPETLVWKPGIDNWQAAKNFPELAPAFVNAQNPQTPPEFNPFQGNNNGYGKNPEPYPFANNPQYREGHTYQNNYHNHQGRYYHPHDRFQNNYRPNFRTNWLPWAIIATVLGFFTSCIGAIFGIIGIVQANKANTFYAQGYEAEGDAANSNAKTMTIIGLIFAGIGIIALFWFGSFFNSLGSFSYI